MGESTEVKGRRLVELMTDQKQFQANGKTYFIEERLSERRFIKYEMLQIQISMNADWKRIRVQLQQLYQNLNQQNFADSCVICRDLIEGMNKIAEMRIPEVVQMCALFMNTEDEDRREISDDLIAKKAEDWRAEGIDMKSFFYFAIGSIPDYIEHFRKNSLGTSGN